MTSLQCSNLRMLTDGPLLVLMMRFHPQGVAGEYRMELHLSKKILQISALDSILHG
ncbi:MAG: hypothetical protein WCP35_14960 [Verrucomicrobiota bacterium]